MVLSYLSEGEADAINGEFANMAETFRVLRDPDPITIARQGGTVIGTFTVVSIKTANREAIATGAGEPLAVTELDGTLKLWKSETDAAPIRRGDRFLWGNQACVIATPPADRLGGVVAYGFVLEARNP